VAHQIGVDDDPREYEPLPSTRSVASPQGERRLRLSSRAVSLRVLSPGEPLGAARGDVVVCIPVFEARSLFEQCLRSVADHTPSGTVLVADDASQDPGILAFTRRVADETPQLDLVYARQPVNAGFVRNMNTAFAACAPGDVVILNSDVVVPTGWLERLRAAAYSDELIATASTLTNHGTLLSVPERNVPSSQPPAGLSLTEAAERVAAASKRLYPRIPTGIGHCLYVRRSALDLAGAFDETFSPGYGEEVDFSQRCVQRGLVHVVADDLFVYHRGGASFGVNARQEAHERVLMERYPYYHAAVRDAAASERIPLARSLAAARGALGQLTVTIDGAALGPVVTGTQLHVLELAGALARRDDVEVRIRVPRSIGETASAALDRMGVERFWTDEDPLTAPFSDIAHRPFQVVNPLDIALLRRLGRAVVVTQQDLIAFHNPAYFDDYAAWEGYRELARDALAAADRVAFFSAHAADEAVLEDLVERDRARVVHIGIDHRVLAPATALARPAALDGRPFLLCLGTDFLHKNRRFALEVFTALRERHGFGGRLVLAGPHAASGTSADEEAAWRAAHPALAADVVDLESVTEPEKAWLYAHAELVLYPTVREGFGLIPFEAAAAGAATMWAAHSSLAELLPRDAATIVPWDAERTAEAAARLLGDAAARERLVAAVRAAGARYEWDRAGAEMLELYREAVAAPLREGAGRREEPLSDLAVTLVGPGGYVPPDVQQALLAVSSRPGLRRPMFAALVRAYRLMYRLRRA
jgi:glycosyltransferase involved in cell wall biosynthesis/GT2 family glycosyltransferase